MLIICFEIVEQKSKPEFEICSKLCRLPGRLLQLLRAYIPKKMIMIIFLGM
jgi:hypothetical protein